jgi:hypothetical protein
MEAGYALEMTAIPRKESRRYGYRYDQVVCHIDRSAPPFKVSPNLGRGSSSCLIERKDMDRRRISSRSAVSARSGS